MSRERDRGSNMGDEDDARAPGTASARSVVPPTPAALVAVLRLACWLVAAPVQSGTLALDSCRAELWAVNQDSGSVTVVDRDRLTVEAEIDVGVEPRAVAVTRDGARVLVADGSLDRVVVIDAAMRAMVASDLRCHGPRGIAASTAGEMVVVTCEDDDTVLLVDGATLAVLATVEVADGPRAVAIGADGRFAWVTHFRNRAREARITVVDLRARRVLSEIAIPPDPTHGYANLLGEIAIAPGDALAWVGGVAADSDGVGQAASRLGAVALIIDLAAGREVGARRLHPRGVDSVSGVGFSGDLRWLYLLHQGSAALSVYELGVSGVGELAARIHVGAAPRGLVVDQGRGFVLGWLDRQLHVIDLAEPRTPRLEASLRLSGREPLQPAVLNGKRLFYDARAPVHSASGNVACASCHPDGGSDGRTWDFRDRGEGLRNTIDLRGHGGVAQGPLHWTGNFDEVQDFEGDIVHHFGGRGLAADGAPPHPPLGPPNGGRSRDLDDLAGFVSAGTRTPRSPYRNRFGGLSESAVRGREVFYRSATGCAACHAPPSFTTSSLADPVTAFLRYDVGTATAASGGRLGDPLDGFDVPTLKGLWDSAPYLHAGQAASLHELLTRFNPRDRHGVTSSLTSGEVDDLVAYLMQLDDSADVLPVRN